jgi:hypothetical protein
VHDDELAGALERLHPGRRRRQRRPGRDRGRPLAGHDRHVEPEQSIFCPSQAHAGCFGDPTCRSFSETGVAPNAALAGAVPQPAKLASTFCIPGTGNNLIDGSVDLPGPAAISLEGTIRASL